MDNDETGRPGQSRALVALAPARPPTAHARYRQTPFLAHLVAANDGSPQTRERRRASVQEAVAAYRSIARIIAQ